MSDKPLPSYRKRIIVDFDSEGTPTVQFKYHPEETVPLTPRELNLLLRALQVQHRIHLQSRMLNITEEQYSSAKER